MPEGLPAVAYDMIHGRFSDEQRQGVFKPALRSDQTPPPRTNSSHIQDETLLPDEPETGVSLGFKYFCLVTESDDPELS